MKTKQFILTLVALLAFAGNAMAQKDITSQYITNATLSNGTNGWTKTFTKNQQTNDPADAFSNSVRGNNTVGYASEAYAGWGSLIQTAYSMKQTITLPAGRYRLVNYSFFRQGGAYNTNSSKSLAFLKAGSNQVALKTLGSIQAGGYANSQAEGANCFDSKMYRNTLEFTIASDNTAIEIGIEGTFDEAKSWCIVGMFELFDLDDIATVSSPTDVTYAITNPGFEYRDLTGWTNSITKGNNTYGNNDNFSSKAGIGFYESWQASGSGGLGNAGTLTQTLANMPAGLYEISVYAQNIEQYNSSAGGTGMFLIANSNQTEISTNGQYKVRTTLQTDGDLTIGIKLENCTGNWISIDRFGLQFYGDPLQAFKELLAGKVTEAQALVDGGTLRTGAANQLQTIINDNDNDDDAFTTEEQFNTAVSNIESGMMQANAIAARYPVFDAEKAKWEVLKAGVPSCASLTTFESAVSTANTAVTNATSVAAVNTQIDALRPAAMTFISTTDDHQFNLTFLASQNYWDWKKKDGSNAGIVADQFLTNRPSTIPSFAESYETTCETTGTVLYQTISDLPAGYYQVGMYAAAMFTSGRGFNTEATEGDADRTYAFAGDLNDVGSILRTGAPISFATSRNFDDLTTLDVNVHLSSNGNLTFGVQKDANGSNWHFAQIMSIVYSNSPDLTQLKATRDALVSEAEGLLSGSSEYLTSAQQSGLQEAIDAGEAADNFDDLNTVTLTTLPNAINTAKQQILIVKANRAEMLAALERFENDYNLADGTDYRRETMSAEAWTTLLTKVNAVSTALDDIEVSSTYTTVKNELVAQMDATDFSLRLFKSYKSMVAGTKELSITEGTTYDTNSYMDTDATEQTAITALNTAFGTFATAQDADFSVAGFLGENLDFSAAAGSLINGDNSNTIKNVTGWEVYYADADTWAVLQTDQSSNEGRLYIRKNWGSAATTLTASKQKMLPAGNYRLTLSWNSNLENMTNLSAYVLNGTSTTIGKATSVTEPLTLETLTYDFEITENAQAFDIVLGFQKQNTGNAPAQIVVDDITLTYLTPNTLLARDYNPDALWFDATDAKYTGATTDKTPIASNQIIKATSASQFPDVTKNLVIGGTCDNLVITDGQPMQVVETFTATNASYSRNMANAWGTLILPYAVESNENVQFYQMTSTDLSATEVNGEEAAGALHFEPVESVPAHTPMAYRKLTGNSSVSIAATNAGITVTSAEQSTVGSTAEGWRFEGFYTSGTLDVSENLYYIANNKFYQSSTDNDELKSDELKGKIRTAPFRAVIHAPQESSAKARIMTIIIDEGEATRIVDLQRGIEFTGDIYTLGGQLIRKNATSLEGLQRGTYIIGGKKVFIK